MDEVDGHFVATRFVALAVPVECVYVSRKGGEPLRIRTDWRSVGLGYARLWFPIVAVSMPLLQGLAGRVIVATWVVSALLIGACIASYRAGRLPEKEKSRLRLLGTVTGLRLDPERLLPSTRQKKRELLGELMDKGGIPTTPDGILSIIDDIPLPAMPLVYGYARYASDAPEWRDCAATILQRHEQAEV